MTFTVATLLALPAARTVSLTPGIGETRAITWAHVCELEDPWRWLGDGALVMTTGIGIPAGDKAQIAYISGLHDAGIAALAVDDLMPAHPLGDAALTHAFHLGFPVLSTAHEVPFTVLAKAVAEAVQSERTHRVLLTEQLYAVATASGDASISALLSRLGRVLGGSFAIGQRRTDEVVPGITVLPPLSDTASGALLEPAVYALPLVAPGQLELRFTSERAVDRALLQHACGVVGSALSLQSAARRSEWLHGSLLLADLCGDDGAVAFAEHLVSAYGVLPTYLFAALQSDDPRTALDEVHAAFGARGLAVLATVKDGQVLILSGSGEAPEHLLSELVHPRSRLGVAAHFGDLADLPSALKQARSALLRNHRAGTVQRFEEHATGSMFLPSDADQLRDIARQVLGPLRTYDEQRGTSLTHTLRVFLEENRSWVRASERLFVHRQTLIARISRIEKIIDRDLASMEDTAECWLAIQAAIGCGDLDPREPSQEESSLAAAPDRTSRSDSGSGPGSGAGSGSGPGAGTGSGPGHGAQRFLA